MKTIYKYILSSAGNFDAPEKCEIELQKNAQILSVQNQKEGIVVYALVDPSLPKVKREFRICGTGDTFSLDIENFKFVGTVQLLGGILVFHVFVR